LRASIPSTDASNGLRMGTREQYVLDDGKRIDGVWLAPEGTNCDTPLIVDRPQNAPHCY
jgi:hypothetical protein